MVGLNDSKTDAAGNSIRKKTGRLNRSEGAMKSAKEDGYDSGGGGHPDHSIKRGVATLQELQDHVDEPHPDHQPNRNAGGDRLLLEDSSSTHSNPPDPYEMLMNQQQQQQQQSHRTPRQHQSHPKPPHHLVPIVHRRTPRQQSKEPNSPKQWGKNIEDSISGILKRLDELAAGREISGSFNHVFLGTLLL